MFLYKKLGIFIISEVIEKTWKRGEGGRSPV